MAKGDRKAKAVESKSRLTRRPKQKGKIKRSNSQPQEFAFHMRTHLPLEMRREQEAEKLCAQGLAPAVARNIASWRARRGIL